MVCLDCGIEMFCNNTREKDNVRFREYRCKGCGSKYYTVETMTDSKYGKKHINDLMSKQWKGVRNGKSLRP